MRTFKVVAIVFGSLISAAAGAQRQPVLAQIDLPHSYYYREMYLPQLTSGPSAAAWSPDSKELIYSMAGFLWRQSLGSDIAQQLTAAAAYDYQPDWSPDGRWVVYCSYAGDAVELWVLDLKSGQSHALTHNGAVNVEPRFSPDGRRVAFVSTAYNKRFHIFIADVDSGAIGEVVRLTGENKSPLRRYYYSAYDHEISPVWSRDGQEIIYVSNRNRFHGTGGIWRVAAPRMAAKPGSPERELHYEESNWRTRPDISPDGSRLVFSSYYGRSWHNLWLMPAQGGDAFALTFGDWDQTNARWSPDGRHIAFISNQEGNTSLNLVGVPGGLVQPVTIRERRYLRPAAKLVLRTLDSSGKPTPARVSVTDGAGRFYAPADAWIHADDGYDRKQRGFEAHYFHSRGEETVEVPAGAYQIEILKGFERKLEQRRLTVLAGQVAEVSTRLSDGAWSVPDPGHWVSGDVHVHMNYAGSYRNTPAHLVTQAQAENLGIVESLIVNKEQRFPDIAYNGRQLDAASQSNALVVHGQEFHTSYWGHLGLLAIGGGIILPGYAGYPNTAAASVYPMNADIADIAHARGALVGYVHPFDEEPLPLAMPRQALSNELPVDVALGKIDYVEILGFSDHRITAGVWYRLLNLGFRIPAAAGTDAMANFASLHGPVGLNRVYTRVPAGAVDHTEWLEALKKGRSFATNGPLLGFSLGGAQIGDELKFDSPKSAVGFAARLRSIVPVDHLEIVCNGEVVRSLSTGRPITEGDFSGSIPVKRSGWCVLRASSDGERYPVLDNYVYATTSPIYFTIAGASARSPSDARFFSAWVDRVAETTQAYPDWNSEAEKRYVMQRLAEAKAVFTALE
jgi:hypothetical protein